MDDDTRTTTASRKSRRERYYATCGGCDSKWTAMAAAHCGACHRTFSTAGLFDRHRTGDHCVDPATIVSKPRDGSPGERLMEFRDGMWRGPEWDAAALRGAA